MIEEGDGGSAIERDLLSVGDVRSGKETWGLACFGVTVPFHTTIATVRITITAVDGDFFGIWDSWLEHRDRLLQELPLRERERQVQREGPEEGLEELQEALLLQGRRVNDAARDSGAWWNAEHACEHGRVCDTHIARFQRKCACLG